MGGGYGGPPCALADALRGEVNESIAILRRDVLLRVIERFGDLVAVVSEVLLEGFLKEAPRGGPEQARNLPRRPKSLLRDADWLRVHGCSLSLALSLVYPGLVTM